MTAVERNTLNPQGPTGRCRGRTLRGSIQTLPAASSLPSWVTPIPTRWCVSSCAEIRRASSRSRAIGSTVPWIVPATSRDLTPRRLGEPPRSADWPAIPRRSAPRSAGSVRRNRACWSRRLPSFARRTVGASAVRCSIRKCPAGSRVHPRMSVSRRRASAALLGLLLSACDAREPGAGLYFRTSALTDTQVDALEQAIAAAPFRVSEERGKRVPGGPLLGEVRLVRGADGPAELEGLGTWLRQRPGIVAVGSDSVHVYR
jgi:hypothetical protein